MQTFLPYPDFQQSAKCLDDKRLGKQRVEVLTILRTLAIGPYQYFYDNKWQAGKYIPTFEEAQLCNCRKTPWYNHPAIKMWRGFERSLVNYGLIICNEWRNRLHKDTCESLIALFDDGNNIIVDPHWLGNKHFHLSHQSNLIRKNPSHYRPIFGNDVPDNLPYIWPVK